MRIKRVWLLQKSYGVTVCAGQCCASHYAKLRKRHGVAQDWTVPPVLDRNGRDIAEMVRESESCFLSICC